MNDQDKGHDNEDDTYPIEDDEEESEHRDGNEQQTYSQSIPGTPASAVSQRQTYSQSIPGTPASVVSQRSQQSTQSYGSQTSNRFTQGGRPGSVMNTPSSVASSRRGRFSQQTPTIMGTPRTPTRRTPQGGGQLPSYSRSPFHSQSILPRSEFGHSHRTNSQLYQSTPNSNAPSSPGDSPPGSYRY